MRTRLTAPAAIFASAVFVACASQSPEGPATSAQSGSTGRLAAASAPAGALEVLRRGGSFWFALNESAPSAAVRDECARSSGGDSATADACYAEVLEAAAHEGIRFSTDGSGHLVWTSYGVEGGKDVVYIEAPLAVTTEGDRSVVGTLAGPPHGLQIEGKPLPAGKSFRFEVVDARTVAMTDSVKGRLVFHLVQP